MALAKTYSSHMLGPKAEFNWRASPWTGSALHVGSAWVRQDPGRVLLNKLQGVGSGRLSFFGRRLNEAVPVDPIRHETEDPPGGRGVRVERGQISMEVQMKVNQVSILVSKKVGRNFCSWSLSYGATAEVEDEHFTEVISQLDNQLKEMVSESLPTPNGNGNHQQLSAP